jgi:hypothetical protein
MYLLPKTVIKRLDKSRRKILARGEFEEEIPYCEMAKNV